MKTYRVTFSVLERAGYRINVQAKNLKDLEDKLKNTDVIIDADWYDDYYDGIESGPDQVDLQTNAGTYFVQETYMDGLLVILEWSKEIKTAMNRNIKVFQNPN